MCRTLLGAFVALAIAAPALAQADDEGPWRRLDIGRDGLWVWAGDADRFTGERPGRATVRVLWPRPQAWARSGGRRVRYIVSEFNFACREGGVQELRRTYADRGALLAEKDLAEVEVDPDTPVGLLFQAACEGASFPDDMELGSVREVLDYEADGARGPNRSRPTRSGYWDERDNGPGREPREPAGEDQEPDTDPNG